MRYLGKQWLVDRVPLLMHGHDMPHDKESVGKCQAELDRWEVLIRYGQSSINQQANS